MLFKIAAGTEILAIKDGDEWIDKNIRRRVTEKDNVFDESEIILKPADAQCKTIGDVFASAGCYGFRRDGWSLLVSAEDIIAL